MLHCGIVGLPLSGKSTVVNVITRAGAEVKPYAGGKTDLTRLSLRSPTKGSTSWSRSINPKR